MKDFYHFFMADTKAVIGLSFVLALFILGSIAGLHWAVAVVWGLALVGVIGSKYTEYKRIKGDKL
jgi:hypothetical protein